MKTFVRPCLILGAVAATLIGCSTPPYVIPENAPLVDLAIKIAPSRITQFSLDIYDNAETCSAPKELLKATGRSSEVAKNGLMTKIPSDKLATFNYREVEGKYSCSFNFSFIPESGKTYLLAEATRGQFCGVRVIDVTDRNKLATVRLIQRSKPGNDCTPITQAKSQPGVLITNDDDE